MKQYECLKCSHEWLPRIENPAVCPRCKSHSWHSDKFGNCKICNKTFDDLVLHHKDGNHKNNNKDNHIMICRKCHALIHNAKHKSVNDLIRKYQRLLK